MDNQAKQLNEVIAAACPAVMDLLSRKGREIYFPKLGILSQSAEAQGKAINATIGIAMEEDGTPMHLACVMRRVQLSASQAVSYAPSSGRPDIRKQWKAMLGKKNPGLAGKVFSLPVVTSALTHGLSTCGYLFCDPGDAIILADLFWENYELIFSNAYGTRLDTFAMFTGQGRFNVEGLRARLMAGPIGKKIVCLNFPNNPTGYTPTITETRAIADVLREAAERGNKLVTLVDDAYFGLVYEPDVFPESIFSLLCDLHPNLLAVKLDGPTKEDYVWGFRVGFITYGIRGGSPAVFEALEAKTGGAIRGNISNAANVSQSLLLDAYNEDSYATEKCSKYEILRSRYERVKQILTAHPEYSQEFTALPFNSGYFMCVRLRHADPEQVRQKLLTDYTTGVIAMAGIIRLAFSAVPLAQLPALFENLFRAARDLQKQG
ncbi:MAG: aminotransferase class I/II-fold pyridoxal phosphate-dependent enzyme [Verrucomicrobiota bacterium]